MIQLPPKEYDHPYAGEVVEIMLSAEEVEQRCGPGCLACSFPAHEGSPTAIIILPKVGSGGVSKHTQDILRRHEIGHCNGWPASHEGGV